MGHAYLGICPIILIIELIYQSFISVQTDLIISINLLIKEGFPLSLIVFTTTLSCFCFRQIMH